MTTIKSGTGRKVQNLQNHAVKNEAKVAKQARTATKPALKEVGTQGIDETTGKDFVARQSGPKTGTSPLGVRAGATPSTDIMSRIKSGQGDSVMFGGQSMDRAVLAGMLDGIVGRGDGRISKADVDKFLPRILDANKITTGEENAMLFGMKYFRFTAAADRELAKGIGEKFPDSALARFGGLSQPPRFADYQQYEMPMLANRAADLYGAKAVMSDAEMATWSRGDMTLADFNDVLKRACQKMPPAELTRTFGQETVDEAKGAMTDAEQSRFDTGRMTPAELQNIQYRAWESEGPTMDGRTPYQEDYTPGFKPFVADDTRWGKTTHLNDQIGQLNARLDAGDVDGMLKLFPEDIVKAQLELGVGKEQFVLEALGLGMVGSTVHGLNEVEHLAFDNSSAKECGPNCYQISGTATLKNGTAAALQVLVDADYNLTSAVG